MIRGREEDVGLGGLGKAVPSPVGILRGKMGKNRQGAAVVSLWLVLKANPPKFCACDCRHTSVTAILKPGHKYLCVCVYVCVCVCHNFEPLLSDWL